MWGLPCFPLIFLPLTRVSRAQRSNDAEILEVSDEVSKNSHKVAAKKETGRKDLCQIESKKRICHLVKRDLFNHRNVSFGAGPITKEAVNFHGH